MAGQSWCSDKWRRWAGKRLADMPAFTPLKAIDDWPTLSPTHPPPARPPSPLQQPSPRPPSKPPPPPHKLSCHHKNHRCNSPTPFLFLVASEQSLLLPPPSYAAKSKHPSKHQLPSSSIPSYFSLSIPSPFPHGSLLLRPSHIIIYI